MSEWKLYCRLLASTQVTWATRMMVKRSKVTALWIFLWPVRDHVRERCSEIRRQWVAEGIFSLYWFQAVRCYRHMITSWWFQNVVCFIFCFYWNSLCVKLKKSPRSHELLNSEFNSPEVNRKIPEMQFQHENQTFFLSSSVFLKTDFWWHPTRFYIICSLATKSCEIFMI